MALEAEQREVLELIQSGKITPEEGLRLLRALNEAAGRDLTGQLAGGALPERPRRSSASSAGPAQWLKLLIEEPNGQRFNISLPARAVPPVLRFAARWVPSEYRDVLDGFAESVETDYRGELLNFEEPNGERVKLWLE